MPFESLKLKPGEHVLAYQVSTIVQDKTIFSGVTQARKVKVSEGVATFDESQITYKDTEGRHESSVYAQKNGELLVYNFKPTIAQRRYTSLATIEREGGYQTLALDSHAFIPARSIPLSAPSQQRRLYVVTNRQVNAAVVDGSRFGIDANGASYGSVNVDLNESRSWLQQVGDLIPWKTRTANDEKTLFSSFNQPDDILKAILPDQGDIPHVLIFVHGIATPFSDACLQCAHFTSDIGFTEPNQKILLFSWPCSGKFTDYEIDKPKAEDAARVLSSLLRGLENRANTIHRTPHLSLMAYSMGSRTASLAVESLCNELTGTPHDFLRRIVFCAAEIPADRFAALYPKFQQASSSFRHYFSRRDLALRSAGLTTFLPSSHDVQNPIGRGPIFLPPNRDPINTDCSDLPMTFFQVGHNYFDATPEMIDELRRLFVGEDDRTPAPPLVASKWQNVHDYWTLQPLP